MTPHRFLHGMFLAALVLLPPLSGARPASAQEPIPATSSHVIAALTGATFHPMDPVTLVTLPRTSVISISHDVPHGALRVYASDNGAALAVVTYRNGRNVVRRSDVWVRVLNTRTGARIGAFDPALPMSIAGISADGRQLYGFQQVDDQGTEALYVIGSRHGRLLGHVLLSRSGGLPLFDPAAHRLFVLHMFPFEPITNEPQAPVLTSYDLPSGRQLRATRLDGVLAGAGSSGRQIRGTPVSEQWVPGFALDPAGRRIAVLDGSDGLLRLIDARTMTLTRTEALSLPALPLPIPPLRSTPSLLTQPNQFEGTSLAIGYSPDGASLYATGARGAFDASGTFTSRSLGLQRIDVTAGTADAGVFAGQPIWWSQVAPDGSAIYVWMPDTSALGGYACPCTLRRLDARTLQVTAQRTFGHSPSGSGPPFYILATHRSP